MNVHTQEVSKLLNCTDEQAKKIVELMGENNYFRFSSCTKREFNKRARECADKVLKVDAVTSEREAFVNKLNTWAWENGYTFTKRFWRCKNDYITIRRDTDKGPFIAQRTAYGSGQRIADITF